MKKIGKSVVVVSESGLHICVDDILTPVESLDLVREIQNGLYDWHILTGRDLDDMHDPGGRK